MRTDVQTIMKRISSTVNQEAVAPSTGGSEYNLWLEYLNRAMQEWSEVNDWEVLRKTFFPSVTGTSQASIAMPLDYKKIAASPRVKLSGDTEGGTEYPEILEEERGLYVSTDKYFYETGNLKDGFNLVFHPGTLASGVSLEVQYFSMPTSLASPAEIPLVTDSQFLIDRVVSYILESRSDSRFQEVEAKARDRLLLMIETANLSKYSSYSNPNYVASSQEKKINFRIGRD